MPSCSLADHPFLADCQRKADGSCPLSDYPCKSAEQSAASGNEKSLSSFDREVAKIHALIKQGGTSPDATFTQSVSQRANDFSPEGKPVYLSNFGQTATLNTRSVQGGNK